MGIYSSRIGAKLGSPQAQKSWGATAMAAVSANYSYYKESDAEKGRPGHPG